MKNGPRPPVKSCQAAAEVAVMGGPTAQEQVTGPPFTSNGAPQSPTTPGLQPSDTDPRLWAFRSGGEGLQQLKSQRAKPGTGETEKKGREINVKAGEGWLGLKPGDVCARRDPFRVQLR